MGWERTSCSVTDTDVYQLHWYLEKQYGLKNERNINKALNIVASENRYHPIRKYLEQLAWDGKYRIGKLLPKYLGAEDDAYTKEIMQLLMLAAIHRIYEPGCKYEIMVCLVGGQGAGKSTFFRFLAINDKWFSDDLKRMDDDNVYRKMQGHWIIEMSEMMATVNAKSIEDIKSFISRQKETYKIPYVIGTPNEWLTEDICNALELAVTKKENQKAVYLQKRMPKEAKITLIGEPVTMGSLAAGIEKHYGHSTRVLCPLKECEALIGEKDKVVLGEEAMEEELKNAKIIVADPLYKPICPKNCTFYELAHVAFSGRIYF